MDTDHKPSAMIVDDKVIAACMRKVSSFMKKKKYKEAIIQLNKVIGKDPHNIVALNRKGDALFELGRYEDAFACYDKVFGIDSGFLDADDWSNKGYNLFNLRKYNLAIECYDRAIKLDKGYKWAWRNKGLALYYLKKYKDAVICYDISIALDPDYADPWNDKGKSLFEMGKREEAIPCYDRAISIDKEFVPAWVNKGQSLSRSEKYEEALKCYDKAIELAPNDVTVWNLKGLSLIDCNRYADAIRCFEKANEVDPGFVYGWRNKATALSKLGRSNDAIQCYQKAIKLSSTSLKHAPHDIDFWIVKGACYRELKDYQNAEKYFLGALKVDPDNYDTIMNLVGVYAEYKYDFNKAAKYMRKALEIDPAGFDTRINYVETLLKVGKYEEARRRASDLLPIAPSYFEKCITLFFIVLSCIFEGDQQKINKQLNVFFNFYRTLPIPFIIDEDRWVFNGLIETLLKSSLDIQSKFLSQTLIDILQGKLDVHAFRFYQRNYTSSKNRHD